MELRLGGVPLAVLMRTPGADADLVLGFALSEAIILGPHEAAGVDPVGDGDRWELVPAQGVTIDPEQFRRNTYTSSSCGVCGKASIDAVRIAARPLPAGPHIEAALIPRLAANLTAQQQTFALTGGLHGAAIFDPTGKVLSSAEDVGRHNAVDKAIGRLARTRWPLGEVILFVSGRLSFEMAQKAGVVGIPVVCGVSAASALAADLAGELGMTLIGFVRGEQYVVYTDPGRLS